MMQPDIRGDAAFARPFHAVRSIEFSPENILSSASFPPAPPKPLLQLLADRLIEILLKEYEP
ncbi:MULTISPECIES: hypothetical protein [Pantoea]|uniref:hypothetical protein n=1 Tax=Pantoea TaxID=53335 RepID=UPI0004956C16|nr:MULTISPECIES: hypothetical protein [Pantoea]MCS3401354.1 hypothetical protein [Pantoea sp. B566]